MVKLHTIRSKASRDTEAPSPYETHTGVAFALMTGGLQADTGALLRLPNSTILFLIPRSLHWLVLLTVIFYLLVDINVDDNSSSSPIISAI